MGLFTEADLAELRAFTDDNHIGTCTIRRPGVRTLDEDTLRESTTQGATVYTGGFQLKESDQAMRVGAGEGDITLQMIDLYVDWDAARIRRNDIVMIDAVEEDGHSWLVGRELLVLDQRLQTQPRNRKLVCTMVESSPDNDPDA